MIGMKLISKIRFLNPLMPLCKRIITDSYFKG